MGSLTQNYANSSPQGIGSDMRALVIGVQLNIPLYQGGAIDSRVREAIANQEKARQDVENARRTGTWADTPAHGGMLVLDSMRLSFTLVFIIIAALTIWFSMVWVERQRLPAGEFPTLRLFATVGMMLMASGGDLVMLFLGLEILSIATVCYGGLPQVRPARSNESSLKYFILGSFSSAFLLYGIALVYGATAHEISVPAAAGQEASPTIMAGTSYVIATAVRAERRALPAAALRRGGDAAHRASASRSPPRPATSGRPATKERRRPSRPSWQPG